MDLKFVSIIVPCRNEEKFITRCLDCILRQDYPPDKIEILIADGRSADGTRRILEDYAKRFSLVRWFDNPGKIVPTGLNILIRQARGEIVVRLDVHSEYPGDYISKCVNALIKYKVDNVGGLWITRPGADTFIAQSIVVALTCGFGIGNAHYRLGNVKEPKLVDTVPFGCYRREVFDKIGLFDEDLVRNQDDEFNARLIKSGGKILLAPDIVSQYYARSSFDKLWRMYYQYGYFKPLAALKLGGVMTWRQLVPALFVGSLVVLGIAALFYPFFEWFWLAEFGAYLVTNLIVSLRLAIANGFLLFPYLMVSFVVIHFGYGIGYLKGILDFVFLRRHKRNKIQDMAISR